MNGITIARDEKPSILKIQIIHTIPSTVNYLPKTFTNSRCWENLPETKRKENLLTIKKKN